MVDKPPYEITNKTVNLVASISALLPLISPEVSMRLRKNRNIRSVHSSLAIENNTLTLEQVTAVINGRRILGSPSEILEVKNAFAAYSQVENYNPFCVSDFLKAHKLIMNGLVDKAGEFRTHGVGIYNGEQLVHAAPKAEFVYGHIENLLNWAENCDVHPLIKSSVVHYEIEFIHPFLDGNGRMGRLWQTAILSKWDPLFLSLPTETIIFERQSDYYTTLSKSDQSGNSTIFIEFMLTAIADILAIQERHKEEHKEEHKDPCISRTMMSILRNLASVNLSRKELFASVGMKCDFRSFKRNIEPLMIDGYIEMTLPDKPTSKLQQYRLTTKGRETIKIGMQFDAL